MAQALDTVKLDPAALTELEASFRGELVRPDDPQYDDTRKVWNASIDRRPALIARCTGVADVVAAVEFAQRSGLVTAVRSGGHSFPGHGVCDGGIVIDLGLMKGIWVDPDARTARAQAGVLLGELDRETQRFGMVVPAGIVTHTGLAGLTLGGGIGHIMRKFGLTVDQLLSADVVTADGRFIKASEKENADLFWALRGGGGNFGIVTSFEFRLNELGPTVLAGPVAWPIEDSPELLRWYREWIKDIPDELQTIVVHRKAPAMAPWPEEWHGKHVVMVLSCYAGSVEEGEKVLRPLKEWGKPIVDGCVPKPFLAHQAMLDPGLPWGWHYYMRAFDVMELNDEIIDISVEHSLKISSPRTSWPIFHLGGAIAKVGEDETPFNGRKSGHTFNLVGIAPGDNGEGFEEERDWARSFFDALVPHQTSAYVNFLLDEGED
ncbi:MAG: FAD-binding oxidoreductase, partial [Candidatus Binatia bacterium]